MSKKVEKTAPHVEIVLPEVKAHREALIWQPPSPQQEQAAQDAARFAKAQEAQGVWDYAH